MGTTSKRLILGLLVAFVAGSSYLLGFGSGLAERYGAELEPALLLRATAAEPEEFSIYWEAWSLVESYFDGALPDAKEQVYGSIRGMLASLADPNTFFIEPPERELEENTLQGRYGGIGAELTMENGYLVVIAPFPDSPAERAGIRPGDIILAVDNQEVYGLSANEGISLIRGPVGTKVTLSILKKGETEPITLELIREEIETPTVTWELKENTGYIKMSFFGERTSSELERALTELRAKSLILDLRNNPGGVVDIAIQVASQFIDSGVIMYEKDAQGKEKPFPAQAGGLAPDTPLTVLVNGGTASASEIVAGALQDHDRATIIGEKTFGKGSMQRIYELSDRSSMHVTVAYWLTPDHNQIQGNGLTPDIEVALTQEDAQAGRDPQLDRALALLGEP